MKKSFFFRKPSNSSIDCPDIAEMEDSLPDNLNSFYYFFLSKIFHLLIQELENNIVEGATKNIFASTKETISNDSIELSDSFPANHMTLSNQEYFSKKIDLKFLGNIKERPTERLNDLFPKKEEIQPILLKIPILENTESANIQNETLNLPTNSHKVFFSFDNESPRKSKIIIPRKSSPIRVKSGWRSHEFKNILFDPKASEEIFQNHLVLTYKGLIYAKEFLRQPNGGLLQKQFVKLLSYGNNFLKKKIFK